MQTPISSYEYGYTNAEDNHHHAYLLKPLLELISSRAADRQSHRLLDLGYGNGSLSKRFAQAGYTVVGVEDSTSGFQVATQNIPECHFIQASIYDLPYQELENAFDVVISTEVIEHLLYPNELLKAAKRCLKPDGQLILTTPYHGYWKNLALAILGKTDQHFNPLWDGGHVKFFSIKTLTQILEKEGFTDIRFKFAGRTPYFWKSMLCSGTFSQKSDTGSQKSDTFSQE